MRLGDLTKFILDVQYSTTRAEAILDGVEPVEPPVTEDDVEAWRSGIHAGVFDGPARVDEYLQTVEGREYMDHYRGGDFYPYGDVRPMPN